ncbi:protein FRA10AC1 [Helicostylum pulchrum]|nr:protein FRA10AC1 [Helicostylum pulchrum]
MSSNKRPLSKCFENNLRGTDAYTRHKKLIKDYVQHYGLKPQSKIPSEYKTERDILYENHKFIREDNERSSTWEQRVAKKYYDKLFKEYAICELKLYKQGKIALRWRVEKEVVSGKGQFTCGSTLCESTDKLKSWEVNFGYMEDGEKKNELVKVRLCLDCSHKLNYKTQMRLAETLKSREKGRQTKRTKRGKSCSDDDEEKKGPSSSSENEEEEEEDGDEEKAKKQAKSVWSQPLEQKDEKSKEEEYEDYFADLLQ